MAAPFLRRFSGAPYVSSSQSARRAILSHLDKMHAARGPGQRLTDLGSGGGEIVLGAASRGFNARGVELNPWLVLLSRLRAFRAHDSSRTAAFRRECMWQTNLAREDVIVCFGVPRIMGRLRDKLAVECKAGAWVCSNTFELPGWTPARREAGVHFYLILKDESGAACDEHRQEPIASPSSSRPAAASAARRS